MKKTAAFAQENYSPARPLWRPSLTACTSCIIFYHGVGAFYDPSDCGRKSLPARSDRVVLGMKLDIRAARCGTYSERSRAHKINAGENVWKRMCLLSSPEATGNRAMSSTTRFDHLWRDRQAATAIAALIGEKLIAGYKLGGSCRLSSVKSLRPLHRTGRKGQPLENFDGESTV